MFSFQLFFIVCIFPFIAVCGSAEPIETDNTSLAIYGISTDHETSLRAKRSCGGCCSGGSCCGTLSICAPFCCPPPPCPCCGQPSCSCCPPPPCSCCGQPSCTCCSPPPTLVIPVQTCSSPCSCCGQPSCPCSSCCSQPTCCPCCQPVCTPVCIMAGGCSCGCSRGGCRRKRNSFLAIANEELQKRESMPAINLYE
uniref:Uncharacterized protein n=1 Tax=Acrobeloides nanus TaxID=290746 RepID=A0A914E654_9BILA